jgi:hypothetical protein
MYFRNVLCTVALATLASAAVAKQIPTPYDDDVYEGEVDEVFERDAEAEPARTAAWEEAHGGPAPSYHYGEEEQDAGAWHVARDAEAEPSWQNGQPPAWLASLRAKAHKATNAIKSAVPTIPTATHLTKPHTKQSGGLKKHHGAHKMHAHTKSAHARDVDDAEEDSDNYPDLDEEEISNIMTRDVGDIPDFGELDVDTSLDGLLGAHDVDTSEEEEDVKPPAESEQDLSGYDSEILARRNADGSDNTADYSPEDLDAFYNSWESAHNDHPHEARDLSDDDNADYNEYLAGEEHRALAEGFGATKRDVDDYYQDEEEFDAELHARQEVANDEIPNDEIPEIDEEDIEGFLQARSADGSEVPDFGDLEVDTSLEGMSGAPIHARGVDDEDLEGDGDVDANADAAYEGEEVVEELVAPVLG